MPSLNTLTKWDITVSGSDLGANFTYTPAESNFYDMSAMEAALGSSPFAICTVLIPSSPMTNAGSVDCSAAGPCSVPVTGAIATDVVPEAASILLCACGGFFLYSAWQRSQS